MRTLPDSIGDLENLHILDLSINSLTILPESIGNLDKLNELDVNNNQLATLPASLGNLVNLQTLKLYMNQIVSLPESIGNLTQLRYLYLSDNRIGSLPGSMGNLIRLEILFLGKNSFSELRESLSKLFALKRLSLAWNQIETIPEWISQLSQLEVLDLSLVDLVILDWSPASRTWLGGLITLSSPNRPTGLNNLPGSIRELASLRELYLGGNGFLGVPPEVLGLGWHAELDGRVKPADIFEYYFRIQVGRQPLNEAKLILVGRGFAGKTSLVNRLVHDRFDKDEKKTDGIRITQ